MVIGKIKLHIYRPKLFLIIAVMVAGLVGAFGVLSLMRNADVALADTAPVGTVTTSGRKMYYTIAQSGFTSATSTRLAIYYDTVPTAANQITILAPDDSGTNRCSGNLRINVYVGGYSDANRKLFNTPACPGAYDMRFSALGNATYDSNVGKYKVLFEMRRHSGDNTYLRFRVDANGGAVRSVGGGVMSYETSHPPGSSPTFGNYRLNFGSDCTINSAQRRTISISDPDNYPHDTTKAQRNQAFYVSVREATRTRDFYDVPGGRYGDLVHTTREGSGNRLKPMVDNAVASFTLDMHPGNRYQLIITNLDHNNTIQVTLPTDEIYHDVPCRWWEDASRSGTGVNIRSYGQWASYGSSGVVTSSGQEAYFAHRVEKLIANSSQTLSARSERYWTTSPSIVPSSEVTSRSIANMVFTADGGQFNYSLPSPASPVTISASDFSRSASYLCERIAVRPLGHQASGVSGGWGYSTPACVQLQRSYNVTPSVTLGSTSIEEGSTSVSRVTAILNKAGSTPTDPGIYFLSRFVLRASPSVGSGVANVPYANGSNLISSWRCYIPTHPSVGVGGERCGEVVSNGTPSTMTSSRTVHNSADDISSIAGDLRVGDRVCYILGLTRYERQASDSEPLPSNRFRYSAPVCAVVAKSPKVQFWGGDVRSGGDVRTTMSTIGGSMYGSWAEYAIMSEGAVVSASGAALSSGNAGRAPVSMVNRNQLTFANTPNYGNFGDLNRTTLPGYYTDNSGNRLLSSDVSIAGLSDTTHYRDGNLTISGGEVRNKALVVKARGTVRITGNITYAPGAYASASDLPQLIISAQRIVIDEGVNRVDAWLIAGQNVSTCNALQSGPWTNGLSSQACNRPLTINGPVIADSLYLRRTFGADGTNRATPAEILNLRPDTYLWGAAQARSSSAIGVESVRELPPRY